MFLPLVLVGLSAAGCGIDTKGSAEVDSVRGGSGGSGGSGGGSSGSGGEGGVAGSGGASGASGSAGTTGNGGQAGQSGAAGSAGLGGKGGSSGGKGGQAGESGAGGASGKGGFSGMSGGTGGLSGGMAGTGGLGGAAGLAGSGGKANPDAYVPQPLRPAMNQSLPATRSYLLWKDGPIPDGLTVAGYDVCSTTGPMTAIDGENECPNPTTVAERYHVLDGLSAGATYLWKIRTHFSDASMSSYDEARSFSTDASQVGWWKMNGSGTDTSGLGHAGTLQGGASFASGLLNEALSLDGVDDSMTVPSSNDHNFGSGDFTLSAWIRPAREGVAETVIAKRSASNGYALYRTSGNKLAFYGSGCGIAVTGGDLPKGEWHRISVVRTAGVVSLFVDDASAGSSACADDFTNGASLTFGCDGPDLGCGEPFQGLVDDVQVRKTASDAVVLINDYCAGQALIAGGVDLLPASCK